MFNPPNSLPDFSSYEDLQKRMIQRFREASVEEKILDILRTKYEKEFAQRNIILSRPERNRLFRDVVKTVLNDVLAKLGE
jgi:hypothetical protein